MKNFMNMHCLKKVSILLFVVSFSFPVFSQSVNWGLSAKMINSDIRISSPISHIHGEIGTHRDWSFGLAGLVAIPLVGSWDINIEPGYYFNKYGKDAVPAPSPEQIDRIDFEHHYLSLPVYLQYSFWDKIGVEAGPEFSYLIDFKTSSPVLSKSHFESTIWSVNFGLKYMIHNNIDLGIRYSRGLSPSSKFEVIDLNGLPAGDYYKEYPESFQALVSFWF